MVKAARRRHFDVILVWKLDRLGRSLQHLIALLDEVTSLGCGFVSLGESIDLSTSAGRLQMHLLAAFAQFEKDASASVSIRDWPAPVSRASASDAAARHRCRTGPQRD